MNPGRIQNKTNKIHENQITTGKIVKYCCDFKLPEEKFEAYEIKQKIVQKFTNLPV